MSAKRLFPRLTSARLKVAYAALVCCYSAISQAEEAPPPTASNSPAANVLDTKDPELHVLDSLVDRSGPIASIGVIKSGAGEARLVGTAFICASKGLLIAGDDGEREEPWLFASPLWASRSSSRILPGVNVFNLSIQGYDLDRADNPASERHVTYIFTMLKNRTSDLASQINDPAKATRFRTRGLELAQVLASPSLFDIPGRSNELRKFEDFVRCYIRIKALMADGRTKSYQVNMSVAGVVFWLANYVKSEHLTVVRDFEAEVARSSK